MQELEEETEERMADPHIAMLLKGLGEANDSGRLRCLAVVAIGTDSQTRIAVLGHSEDERLLGALERMKWCILKQQDEDVCATPPSGLH